MAGIIMAVSFDPRAKTKQWRAPARRQFPRAPRQDTLQLRVLLLR
jgi:hypothetical protein